MKKSYILCSFLVVSTLAFSQWTLITPAPTGNDLYSVYFPDANTGYVVGTWGTILKTTNGGLNWTTQESGTTNGLESVYFTDTNTGYAVGLSGTILKTINGGTSWITQASGIADHLNEVFFVDSNTGYAAGGIYSPQLQIIQGTIIKTNNGGATWYVIFQQADRALYSIYFTDAETGYAVGYFGHVLKTTNGGNSWTDHSCETNSFLTSVFFPNADTGYVVSDYGEIFKTIDQGENWTLVLNGLYQLHSVFFSSAEIGYAVGWNGSNGTIFKTEDGGVSWFSEQSGSTDPLLSVYFTDDLAGYVVGCNGTILKTTDGGTTSVEENGALHSGFSLYPNPANNKITVKSNKFFSQEITLSIFNSLGKKVVKDTFFNQAPVEVDVNTLAKGIYLVKIQAKAGIEVKKLVIE